tara:strand:+ start:224 stop:523 length:300 start_codon:yes stop_codon:yes gene_type:complete
MRNLLAILLFAGFTTVVLADFTDLESAAYNGKTKIKQSHAAIDANFEKVKAQSDTNSTTTVTLYTPDYIGQALLGNTGGTNYTWMARGTTTNDWSQIAP